MSDVRGFTHLLCGKVHASEGGGDDEEIAQLAVRQQGCVARRQLLELGVSGRSIDYRVRVGRLRPRFRGAYAVGHEALSPRGVIYAALLTTQPGTVTSHWTTAFLRNLVDHPPRLIHLTSTQPKRPQHGLVLHRASVRPDEAVLLDGIPTTSIPRTLLDLSALANEQQLRRLVKRAEFARLTTVGELAAILARHPRKHGRRALARIVGSLTQPSRPSRSEFEDRFLEFCRRFDLPLPETNVELVVDGTKHEVDCLWRGARLVLELDSRQAHETATAFEDDRARDRALLAAGWRPARATWAQLHRSAEQLASELRAALARP